MTSSYRSLRLGCGPLSPAVEYAFAAQLASVADVPSIFILVIALALQLQTILGEQLASDDQAADVVDIGTVISLGDGIARVYGCEA